MASKKAKVAPTDDELKEMLEGIGSKGGDKPKPTSAKASRAARANPSQTEEDLLAELGSLGAKAPVSRPHTPRVPAGKPASSRTSEDKPSASRRSVESTQPMHASVTPSATSSDLQDAEKRNPIAQSPEPQVQASGSGGWWGGIFATATAAVKTAEAAVKEIQQNEEAKRWAEQVRGNVGQLRDFGGELRSRAMPTFTNILHTLAPPISSHERLQIHITHDLIGYPSLDPLIYSTFARVMAQVEGGDLIVLQRGHESTARRNSDIGYTGGSAGWNDGPWWRQSNDHRDLGAVKGLVEGTKLVRVSAESYSAEYFASHGGLEQALQRATEEISESNPVRSSDIFLAVQAISHEAHDDLFQGPTKAKEGEEDDGAKIETDELITFAIYLCDPVHSITFHTITQSVPARWLKWLDAPSPLTPSSSSDESYQAQLPDEIHDIIESGGVDPREWVAEWVEELLTLGTGIVAQRYVARRMGVGEGSLGRKAQMAEVLEEGGGEVARAGLI